ncbi:MAG TPA: hypothetical protein VMV00_01710 [Candidatus Baltobacteraceae bacterium]|nr:hypothetical protein [Candidatus Baltobacteraceae bacterium]
METVPEDVVARYWHPVPQDIDAAVPHAYDAGTRLLKVMDVPVEESVFPFRVTAQEVPPPSPDSVNTTLVT